MPHGTLAPSVASSVAAHLSPQIFSQEDQKDRRFLGLRGVLRFSAQPKTSNDRLRLVRSEFNDCSAEVIAACMEVHRELGPGLLEAMYEECLCNELEQRGLLFERQKAFEVYYKGRALHQGYRTDLVVEGSLLVELKAVEALLPIHVAQTITYLRICKLDAGLLVNFNAMTIRHGLRRVFRHPPPFCPSDLPVKKSGSV
jgi:GxxExxY protein